MQKITAVSPEAKSADIVAENIAKLKELFPEAFAEDGIDFEVLKQLLGGAVNEKEEKYSFTWLGKRQARQIALNPSLGTLRPVPEESVDWENTKNLFIEGDNLEVLKLLQKSYSGKIKMIYIDPPYNTGNDFVYPDDYRDNIKNYLALTGQMDTEGKKLTSNSEKSGSYHGNWLSMIQPRFHLAKKLLRDDGIIIVSVDDVEFCNTRKLLDEEFGEENFIATLVFDKNRKNDAKYFSVGHEYMVIYFKNKQKFSDEKVIFRGEKEGVEELRNKFYQLRKTYNDDWERVRQGLLEYYATIDADDPRQPLTRFKKVDEKGPYRDDGNINWPGGNGPMYEILHPKTKQPCKFPISGWRYPTPERFWEEVENGRIVFGPDETTVPRVRTNIFDNTDQVMVSVHYSYAQTSTNKFNELFDGQRVFDNPKSITDIASLIAYLCADDDIILDFFAGSATTAHAVMIENSKKCTHRRFIMVQLPEVLDVMDAEQKIAAIFCSTIEKPRNIAEIAKERIRRAAAKIKAEYPDYIGDLGFRVFKLDSSNIRPWNPDANDVAGSLLAYADNLLPDRTEQDLLYEVLLKFGLDLTSPMQERAFAGHTIYSMGQGVLFACLSKAIAPADIEPIGLGIADWRKEANPVGESTVIFRDSAFAGDVAKANMTAILQQHGIDNVRSL